MYSFTTQTSESVTVIYSPDFTILRALEGVFGRKKKEKIKGSIHSVQNIDDLFIHITSGLVSCVILDLSAGKNVRLLCSIRRHSPKLPIIITKRHHLFADHVAAGWFGNIWLLEHDSLLVGFPDSTPDSYINGSLFAGAECAGCCSSCCSGKYNSRDMFIALQRCMREQLSKKISSRRGALVILNWLAPGLSPQDIALKLGRSVKMVYYYRWRVMKALEIRNAIELIPSITLKEGNEPKGSLLECRMQQNGYDRI